MKTGIRFDKEGRGFYCIKINADRFDNTPMMQNLCNVISSVTLDLCFLVLTDWETCNKYQIKNSLGQQVFFAAEGSYRKFDF